MDSKISNPDEKHVSVGSFAKTEQGLRNLMNPELYKQLSGPEEIADWMMHPDVGLFLATVPGFSQPQLFLSIESLRQNQNHGQ